MNDDAALAQAVLEEAVLNGVVLDRSSLDEDVLNEEVQENVRRYRAIASLCRQTAAFRPIQKLSLLQQAEEWERLAISELESHCAPPVETVDEDPEPYEPEEPEQPLVDTRWWLPRREGLFAGLQA